ncbi:transcription factor GLABRA 3-like isoform X2 [Phoenix dactylifera]|uniref:Transcription factor GLABRA 3-like isoform X2 n=1 Tax=Phoenix dactylifera TaxID=42345 RepID=A0A8B9A7V4_PHODC|nr:transcription factor GLABRA 3-like isoform X2 [Phoenix dactylifera]
MATGAQIPEEMPEKHRRKQLATTVRNIRWSYAIFWSISTRQQGVLAWRDGYYNGDIKTRKTTQLMEFKADQIALQRSEQLRELYESLSAGDSKQPSTRPASLSPEDLTEAEWYYLVCMSFTFSPGQGLPGKALTSNQYIWLSNAQFADSGIFSRSLLAKSASIQTVVCIPFMYGVLELGTAELVLEDPALIHQIRTSFWELPIPVCSGQSISSSPLAEKDEDTLFPNLDHEVVDTMVSEDHHLMAACLAPLESGPSAVPFDIHSHVLDKENELIQDKVEELCANISEELKVGSPDASASHVLSERRRREKLNEKFLVLRSLVPFVSKVDKASILGGTIEYLKELERRVEELESCRELGKPEPRGRRMHPDIAERTSDNYGNKKIANGMQSCANKRKACDIDETAVEHCGVLSKDGPVNVIVTVMEKEVLLELQCQWRECLLLEVVDAIRNLHLDPLSVQSSTGDNNLAVTIKAKFKGSVVAPPGMIKRTLQRVVGKC